MPFHSCVTDMFRISQSQFVSFLVHELSQVCKKRNTTGATSGSGTAYLSEAHAFTHRS